MKLSDWHTYRRANPRDLSIAKPGTPDVTVVSYIYGTPDYIDTHFYQIANAILETWFHNGFLTTVIVTSKITNTISKFVEKHRKWVRADVCTSLLPGDLYNYSRDCIANLSKRFSTPYVLFIHPDGFPLRSGLEEFLNKYDYIGAPWKPGQDDWIGKALLSQNNFVGNGGFSLRSRKICDLSAKIYSKIHWFIPNIFILYEDYFITRFLPKFVSAYRKEINFAPIEVAQQFAVETTADQGFTPFGFHSATAFEILTQSSTSITL